jgi:adenine-specific DNA-methyltransferase
MTKDDVMPDQTNEPDKLDLRSHDIAADKRRELLRLFPEIRTEGDKLDFDRLKLALGGAVDVGKERYGMNWPGKADCFRTIQAPSLGTLRPCPEESVNFDTTENMIIEGDNLEVLKLLQKSYLGKVKMIYIDPPYNTGNDFIYPDNYTESLQTYLEYTGQVDAEGKRFGTNSETDGRFHSKWLMMMYPRVYLARNLLRDDGLAFVSCDDGEVSNLRYLLNEIFGEENFVADIIWKKSYGGGSKTTHVVILHEHVLAYARSKNALSRLELPPDPRARRYYKLKDAKFETRGPYRTQPLATTSNDERENLRYGIPYDGEEIWPEKQWQWGMPRTMAALANDELVITKQKGEWSVYYKQYLYDEDGVERGAKPYSVLEGPYTQTGTSELTTLLGDPKIFPFPKPSELIQHFLQYAHPDKDFIIVDFFAGSGSTAHAVLSQNAVDGGRRVFVSVQLPEPTGREDYQTISDITKERVRRVIKSLNDEDAGKLDLATAKTQPRGFRVFKLAESNFMPWEADQAKDVEGLAKQLHLHVDHIRDGRGSNDLLHEILLKSGFLLTTPIEPLALADKTVYSVASGEMFICLERKLTLDLIRAMAERRPGRVVCLDSGFAGDDQLKANAVQIFKTKGVTSFKTV